MSILEITAAEYHADPCDTPSLSASIAAILVGESPAHARAAHPRLSPTPPVHEEKREWDIGTVAHSLLLEGYDVAHVVEGYDNWRTKDAQGEAIRARASGKIPMLRKEWEEVAAMVDAARAGIYTHDAQPPLLSAGKAEQTLVCTLDGVLCRVRIDWLRDDFTAIDDYKTARSAEPRKFSERSIYDHGYEIKAAFYLRVVKEITGVDAEFRWIVQEKKPPYAMTVVSPGPDVLALANEKVQYAIDLWRGCLERDVWPAYPTRVCWAELPAWEESRWLAREDVAA